MNYNAAVKKALRLANKTGNEYFVFDEGEYGFAVGDEFDAETYFAGSSPVFSTFDF